MKKILSLILCLTMLLSLGTLAISAEKIDGTDATVVYANYGTATVDGLKDASMHIGTMQNNANSGSFAVGATWNADTLVVGVSGLVIFNKNYDKDGLMRTRAYPFKRGGLCFENGYIVEATKAEGLKSGAGATFAMAAEETIKTQNHYGGTQPGSNTGVYYVEYSVPMSALNFYDMGDGTLATQVKVEWVGLKNDETTEQYLSDDITLVLTANAMVGDCDILGQTGTPTYRTGVANGAYLAAQFDPKCALYLHSKTTVGARAYASVGGVSSTCFPAGVASVAEAAIALYSLPSGNGPVAAESWTYAEWATKMTVNSTANANPGRLVLVTTWAANGENVKSMVGYSIYNVNGEVRLYSTEADDVNDPHVVLTGVAGSAVHAAAFTLRLEFDASYNATVLLNGRKVGTLAAPTVKAAGESHPLNNYSPDELTIWGITGADATNVGFSVTNMMVATKSADAVAALEALGNSFTVYGHQDTVKAVDGKYSVRFLAELPATLADYTALGYDIVITNEKGTAKTTVDLTRVYESVSNDTTGHDGLKAVVALRDIKTADGNCTITVKPWVVAAKGGEKLYGEAYSVTYTAAADGTLSFE